MSEAADDALDTLYQRAMSLEQTRANIRRDCPQWDCDARLVRNSDGLLECKDCGETFDD